MNLRQAAQQALEALMKSHTHPLLPDDCEEAIAALRAALAEPEQNPFGDDAERYARKLHEEREYYKALFTEHKPQTTHWEGCEAVHPECKTEPLAAWENKYGMKEWQVHAIRAGWMPAPTPRKPLTDEEISAILDDTLEGGSFFDVALAVARAIERAHGIGEQHE